MKITFVLLTVILSSLYSVAQEDTWIDARGKAGFLVAHRSIMGHLATEHAFAGELSFIKRGKGEKSWHSAYGYPSYGFTAFFGSTGNRKLMGHYIGAYTFLSLPILRYKAYTFSYKMGCGLGYGTKIYDPDDSDLILSMAVGSHFNAMVCMGVESRFEFNNHSFTVGLDMTHFSNGAAQVPNLGLNLPYVSMGYGHRIQKSNPDSINVYGEFKPYWQFGVMGIASAKEIYPTGGRKYPVLGLNLVGRRYFNRGAGMEMSFDFFSKQAIMGFQSEVPKTQAEIIQLGVFAGYILPMDRLHLIVGMGLYVRDKFKPEDPMYHRVGLRYVWGNGLNMNLVLKSHWARADYVEYGIGYTFRR